MDKLAEVFLAPVGAHLPMPRTRVVEREGWFQLITPGSALQNEVVHSRVAAAEADRVVRDTIAEYGTDSFLWCVSPLTEPADFGDVLDRHGFASYPIRGMAIEPAAWRPDAPAGVTVEPVTEANLDDYVRAFARGWDVASPDHVDSTRRGLATGRFAFWLARVDGEPAATAGLVRKPHSAYLIGGNVMPAYRGRGLYRALVDTRLRWLAERGVALATTQAREKTSAPILERFGFETVYRSRIHKR